MDRRNFLKISTFAAGATAITNLSAGVFKNVLGRNAHTDKFSLELITDDEEKAIKLSENFIGDLKLDKQIIKFSEYGLTKSENGDLVYLNNGKLINYKSGNNDINTELREIANELSLPRIITNPVRLRFYTQPEESAACSFLVFHKNNLVKRIDASASNVNFKVQGTKGSVSFNINNGKARVTESSCTHKNCIHSGSISIADESIVCIPNEVFILAE